MAEPKHISTMTDAELRNLISKAAAELQRRAGVTPEHSAMDAMVKALAPKKSASEPAIERPSAADADFAMYVKRQMKSGGYLKASERARIAEIAVTHGPWIEAQGLPTTSSAGEWRRQTKYSSAPRARERR